MFKNLRSRFSYTLGGVAKVDSKNNDDFSFDIIESKDGFALRINAKKKIFINECYVEFDYDFTAKSKFFANGFQSWTDTKEFDAKDKHADLGWFGKSAIGKAMGMVYTGDYTFVKYTGKKGVLHSHGYAYVREGNRIDLFGTTGDRNGYTVIQAYMNENKIRIYKDVEGVAFEGESLIMDIVRISGEYDNVFDNYFEKLGVKMKELPVLKGYTTWYNYYQNINQEIVDRDLNALAGTKTNINVFQIDDGYQMKVGEWLNINEKKFPQGMKVVADSIHEKGLMAGIWLAPFGVQKNSDLIKQHPDWFVQIDSKPFNVGANWGGFCALDIYNEGARNYIKSVFNTVLNEWGYDLVKLDFLYAAAVLPRNGKSRSQIMYEAMDLLRECVGDKLMLGCGVQMLPCFGKADYMRIGADMGLGWRKTLIERKISHREDVSTVNALNNSFYRRHLNNRAFLCDPDVFLLRDYNLGFSFEQRKLLARLIKMFGSILFTSDDVGRYSGEQLQVMQETFADEDIKILSVDYKKTIYSIDYMAGGRHNTLVFDMKNGKLL